MFGSRHSPIWWSYAGRPALKQGCRASCLFRSGRRGAPPLQHVAGSKGVRDFYVWRPGVGLKSRNCWLAVLLSSLLLVESVLRFFSLILVLLLPMRLAASTFVGAGSTNLFSGGFCIPSWQDRSVRRSAVAASVMRVSAAIVRSLEVRSRMSLSLLLHGSCSGDSSPFASLRPKGGNDSDTRYRASDYVSAFGARCCPISWRGNKYKRLLPTAVCLSR